MGDFIELMGFGPQGWGALLLKAALMTIAVTCVAFVLGSALGCLIAWARISGNRMLQVATDAYTTVLRGIPDLLIIYLLYFGGSTALTALAKQFGASGFVGVNAFGAGAVAIGIISAAYQGEVFRGAYSAIATGELEAARAMGMPRWLMFRRIIAPQTLRYALPGLGNVWQIAVKESALVSVVGLTEILRQAQVGAGSTRQPFAFYFAAILLYLTISTLSGWCFQRAETATRRGIRKG